MGLVFHNQRVVFQFILFVLLLILIPVGGFYISRNYFTNNGFSKDQALSYAGYVSICLVNVLLVLYCCLAVKDKSNFEYE